MNPVLSPSASLSVWRARARVRACALGASALLAACGGGGEASETSSGAAPQARAQAVVDPVTAATGTGDASGVTLAQVMSATRTLLAAQPAEYAAIKQALFGLNADGSRGPGTLGPLDWNPSHDSVWFSLLDTTQNRPILVSNWSYKGGNAGTPSVLAVAGTLPSGTRYAAFGGNPLGVRGNAATDQLMQRTIAWLTRRTSFAGLKVVTAHLPGTETYWFPHESRTRSWLASTFPGVTINGITTNPATQADNRCDGDRLDACLQGAHLLVIGREQGPQAYDGPTVMKAVQAAQSRGIPVLYLHHYRDSNDLSGRLLEQFGLTVTNNYWADNGLQAFDAATLPSMPGSARCRPWSTGSTAAPSPRPGAAAPAATAASAARATRPTWPSSARRPVRCAPRCASSMPAAARSSRPPATGWRSCWCCWATSTANRSAIR